MGCQTVLSLAIFLGTLVLVICRPKGLGIGFSAMGGSLLILTTGIVSLATIPTLIWAIIANISFTLVGLIAISWILQKKGVFRWLAFRLAHLNLGSGKLLFATLLILTALCSGIFTNYGSTLLFIPIVIETLVLLEFNSSEILPFIIACGFVADTSSISFTISNLVNSISATASDVSVSRYGIVMFPVGLVAIVISLAVLLFYFWSDIPRRYKKLKFSQENLKTALPEATIAHQRNINLIQKGEDKNDLSSPSVKAVDRKKIDKILANILSEQDQV